MRVLLLEQAQDDLKWWRHYCRSTFPQGRRGAFLHFEKAIALLSKNPFIGRKVEGFQLHQLPITNTPFSIIYRLRGDTLEIVRVWDMRRKPSHGFHEE